MATILLNCVFLAMTETIEEAEYIFLAIYTAEMIIKGIAKGFILNKYTYLRNPWNWLDFVVITSGYATIGMEVGNLAGLRTFRVLRALKTISILPGIKRVRAEGFSKHRACITLTGSVIVIAVSTEL
ncbi:Ion transport protein [Popillia japonica]|uniref:Ion transport protein n=1 Tax=Popillia japonica TaxID=7064 RepID=A0AAW1IDE6_POPJA